MRNNESGRSMVEMLGVLAVIGVLSIGGIAGYTYAMNRLKANDIIDGVNKRAVALSTYTLLGTGVSATTLDAEFANKIGDFPVALAAADPGFTLTVSEITRPVCNHVLNNGVQMARTITLGATKVWENGVKADYTCAEDGNTIVFTFAPGAGEGGNTPTCGYCQHNENGTCVADETCDNGCPGDKPMKGTNGTCYSCSDIYERRVDATECAKCSNRYLTSFGRCGSCDSIIAGHADASECAKCPNRFRDIGGYCRLCNGTNGVYSSETECAKCSNRFWSTEGICVVCSDPEGNPASASECAKCSEREMYNGDYCALKDCSGFRSNTGGCYDCSSTAPISPASASECAKCPEREMYNGYCVLKGCSGFRVLHGSCYACNSIYAFAASETECAKCPEREMYNGKCVLKECPSGKTKQDDGSCA